MFIFRGSTTGANTQANLSLTLQQTSLTVSSNQTFCRQRLSLYNPQRMFCAWDADLLQRSNVCFGDSGIKSFFIFSTKINNVILF